MKKILGLLVVLGGLTAQAQVRVEVALPSIHFEIAPPLVMVAPGVQVVPEYQEEVFFTDGWYWVRRDERWFRSRDYQGHWVVVEPRVVPVSIVEIPSGRYRNYKHEKKEHEEHHEGREHGHGKGKWKGKHKGK